MANDKTVLVARIIGRTVADIFKENARKELEEDYIDYMLKKCATKILKEIKL